MADDHLDTEIAGYRAGRVLRVLGRPLRVTEPCVGLGGLRRLCELSGSQYLSTQGFDTEASLLPYYNNLQRFCGASGVQALRLGTDGDVEKVNPESLLPVEAIVAGPPCQPWAGTGQQQGTADARASVMDVCIGWIIAQAWQGQLLAFAVENSPRLRGTPYLRELLQRLRACIPMFAVSVEVHDLCQLCPQHRERLWIRGLRRDCLRGLPGLPPPLSMKDLGGKVKVPLETVLVEKHGDGKVLKPTDPGSLSPNMQCNLAAYLTRVQGDIENGKAGEIAVIELDRNPLKDFGGGIVYDGTPPLRTKGPKLWLLRTQDVKEKRPWQEHSLHRYMLQEEKAMLQGHEPRTPWLFSSQTQAEKAIGNAYHPLHLGIMLCPLLEIAFLQGKLKSEPQTITQEELWQLTPPPEAALAAQLSEGDEMDEDEQAAVHPEPTMPLPIKVKVEPGCKTWAVHPEPTMPLPIKVKVEPECKTWAVHPEPTMPLPIKVETWASGRLKMERSKRDSVVNLASPQRRVRRKRGDC
ncbi:ngoPIIM [Symbiodinium sp. CCMP2592]|nr:ngoPIIM [Symbiodinium sp. CCMP2592]